VGYVRDNQVGVRHTVFNAQRGRKEPPDTTRIASLKMMTLFDDTLLLFSSYCFILLLCNLAQEFPLGLIIKFYLILSCVCVCDR